MAQTFGELFGTQVDQETVNEFAGLKVQQQQSMQEHADYNAKLQQAATGVQERQQDLAATGQFFKLLDTNIPKPARDFLFRESSRALGVDPNSQSAKEIGKLLTQLDPDSAMAIRGMLNEEQQRAGPGAMRKLYTGILKGEVPMSEVLTRVADYQGRAAAAGQEQLDGAFPRRPAPPGMMRLGGPQDSESGTPNSEAPAPSGGGEGVNPPRGTPAQALQRLPHQQFMDPGVVTSLPGTDGSTTRTIEEMIGEGWSGPLVSADAATQRNTIKEITGLNAAYARIQDRLSQLHSLVQNPSLIGPAGAARRWQDSLSDQASGVMTWLREALADPQWVNSVERSVQGAVRNFISSNPALAENAQAAATIRSLIIDAGFQIARQQNPTGVISQADFNNALQTLGNSWSSGQATAVIRSVAERQWTDYTSRTRELSGQSPYRFDRITAEDFQRLRRDPTVPQAFFDEFLRYQTRVEARQPGGPPLVPSLPGQPPNQALPSGSPDPASGAPPAGQPPAPAAGQPPASGAPPAGQPARPGRQSQRMTPQQEQDAARETLRAEQDRQRSIENERLQRERAQEGRAVDAARRADSQLQLQFDQFFRAQTWRNEDLALRERDRIQRSFERLGALIAGGRSGSVSLPRGGGGGAAQDARAFQLPDKPRRQAPAVPQARRREQ